MLGAVCSSANHVVSRCFRGDCITVRPSSGVGLTGGAVPRPGEVSLVHHGVHSLAELPSASTLRVGVEGVNLPPPLLQPRGMRHFRHCGALPNASGLSSLRGVRSLRR
jgi:hypothetical protein